MAKPTLTILGLDPGTTSFGFCVLDVFKRPRAGITLKIRKHGMILATLRNLTQPGRMRFEREAFEVELDLLLSEGVTHIIAERYMLRAGSGGTTIESVNQMLGIVFGRNFPTRIIPASQWKNAVHRQGGEGCLEELYAEVKGAAKITPHQADACHIAYFGAWELARKHIPQMPLPIPLAQDIVAAPAKLLGTSTVVKKKPKKRRKPKA